VILEHPVELKNYIEGMGAKDFSSRDAYTELASGAPRKQSPPAGEGDPGGLLAVPVPQATGVLFGMGAKRVKIEDRR